MATTVRDAMTRRVVAVRVSQWLTEAAILMKTDDLDALPVVSDDRIVGMITDHDIVIRVIAEGLDPHAVRAGEIASRAVVAVAPDQDVYEALEEMARHQVRQLPVIEDRHLVGIISRSDALVASQGTAHR